MPRILLISNDFPPSTPAGALRLFRFARHLPSLGWEVTVATADVLFPPRRDDSLLALLPREVRVVRLPETLSQAAGLPTAAARFVWRVANRLKLPHPYPDRFIGWARRVPAWAAQEHQRRPFDLIFASLPGWSAFHAGYQTHRRLRVPWVADIRDPYGIRNGTSNHVVLPTRLEDRLHADMCRFLASAAGATIIFDPLRQKFIEEYPEVADLADKSQVLPNGWDRLPGFDLAEQPPPQNQRFRLMHVGTTTGLHMDGFFQALSVFLVQNPAAREKMVVDFVGEGSPDIFLPVQRLGLAKMVRFLGPVSLQDSQKLCSLADVLLFFFYLPASQPLCPGSKVYTYLACRRPVLCSAVPGTPRELYEVSGRHLYADPREVGENLQALRTYYQAWENGTLHRDYGSRAGAAQEFEGLPLTRQLAALMECVLTQGS